MMSYKANKPLVAILDAKDWSVEMSVLKDVAQVAFCDTVDAKDLHEKVLDEAYAVLLWYRIILREDDLKRFKALKLIVSIGTGYDNVDVIAAGKLGIAVCNVPGCDVGETADSTMSLILSLYRRTFWLANMVREGMQFDSPRKVARVFQRCSRIRGNTLGIIGFGRVGIAVALRAKEFGFKVAFYNPEHYDGIEWSFGFTRTNTLEDLLGCSDCITLHCSLNDTTYNIINNATIKQMRYGAFLVNTARGGLVNEYDLALALHVGKLRGAALDVHELEPYNAFESPLKYAPNLICTPHVAWFSDDSYRELREMAAHEILRAITGHIPSSLHNCVNEEYLVISD